MKFALISDIHSNLDALQVCIEYIDREVKPDRIICLGDVVGYGAEPAACIDIVRDRAAFTLLGNHDQAVTGFSEMGNFNYVARDAVKWTRENLDDEHLVFLNSLPESLTFEDILFTHSTPEAPKRWHYIAGWADALNNFDKFGQRAAVIGHSHLPGIFSVRRQIPHENNAVIQLGESERYIINAGSIGQPRDGDPRASFCVLDIDLWTAQIVRLEYDVKAAGNKIIRNGLPPFLAERLTIGR